jgi:hypothetical protein
MKARYFALLVAGAIVIAVGSYVLIPTIMCHPIQPYIHFTAVKIAGLATANETFEAAFREYPPSRWTDEPEGYKSTGGAGLLAYYVMGPDHRGWGKDAGGRLPLSATGTSDREYGPYYIEGDSQPKGLPAPVLDEFRPGKPILYFRANTGGREPLFDVTDNPVDPTGQTGFASQEHFEMLVKYKMQDGSMAWERKDFLLISAGPDRLYGYVVKDNKTGNLRPARPDEMAEATCDDVANFSH